MRYSQRFLLVFLLSFLLVDTLYAQGKINGIVIDEEEVPVPFSTILLINAEDSSQVKVGVSDEVGKFVFEEIDNGRYMIFITYVGYTPTYSKTFVIDSKIRSVDLGKVILMENIQTLSEIIIEGQKPLIERKADKYIMNVASNPMAMGNVTDLLRVAPFMTVNATGGISLKGKNNIMVLVDDRPVPNTTLSVILQNMSADEIEKIEFITNPSVKYDASASGCNQYNH